MCADDRSIRHRRATVGAVEDPFRSRFGSQAMHRFVQHRTALHVNTRSRHHPDNGMAGRGQIGVDRTSFSAGTLLAATTLFVAGTILTATALGHTATSLFATFTTFGTGAIGAIVRFNTAVNNVGCAWFCLTSVAGGIGLSHGTGTADTGRLGSIHAGQIFCDGILGQRWVWRGKYNTTSRTITNVRQIARFMRLLEYVVVGAADKTHSLDSLVNFRITGIESFHATKQMFCLLIQSFLTQRAGRFQGLASELTNDHLIWFQGRWLPRFGIRKRSALRLTHYRRGYQCQQRKR